MKIHWYKTQAEPCSSQQKTKARSQKIKAQVSAAMTYNSPPAPSIHLNPSDECARVDNLSPSQSVAAPLPQLHHSLWQIQASCSAEQLLMYLNCSRYKKKRKKKKPAVCIYEYLQHLARTQSQSKITKVAFEISRGCSGSHIYSRLHWPAEVIRKHNADTERVPLCVAEQKLKA